MKMNTLDFLNKELGIIAEKFPHIHIKYGYDNLIETHIVELLPLDEYIFNEDLDNSWIPLSIKFMETFTEEEIAFISSDSSLKIENVILEFNVYTYSEDEIITELFGSLTDTTLNYTFSSDIVSGEIMPNSISNYFIGDFSNYLLQQNGDEIDLNNSYLVAA